MNELEGYEIICEIEKEEYNKIMELTKYEYQKDGYVIAETDEEYAYIFYREDDKYIAYCSMETVVDMYQQLQEFIAEDRGLEGFIAQELSFVYYAPLNVVEIYVCDYEVKNNFIEESRTEDQVQKVFSKKLM